MNHHLQKQGHLLNRSTPAPIFYLRQNKPDSQQLKHVGEEKKVYPYFI